MKTSWIRDAVETLEDHPNGEEAGRKARAELDALEASDHQARVADFHRACGLPVASEPTVGTPEQRALRVRLMLEEVLEFAAAAGVSVFANWDTGAPAIHVSSKSDLTVAPFPGADPDLMAMTHELADVQYVTSGTAVELGLPLSEAFAEVHGANMRKVGPDGKVVMVNGKVCKPEGWTPADVAKVLAKRKR